MVHSLKPWRAQLQAARAISLEAMTESFHLRYRPEDGSYQDMCVLAAAGPPPANDTLGLQGGPVWMVQAQVCVFPRTDSVGP